MASGGSRASRHCSRPMMERRRPAMLKDFLAGDVDPITPDQPAALHLRRSRSRSRAAVSALQKLLNNAVKLFPYAVKSRKANADEEAVARVRVKDILRWTSFTRQVIDGPDYAGVENLRVVVGGEDPVWAGAGTGRVPYSDVGQAKDKEEDQKSPVSVLDSKFASHKQDSSSFDQSLANVEKSRERLMERIKWFETLVDVDPCTSFHGDSDEEFDPMEETPKGATQKAHVLKLSMIIPKLTQPVSATLER